MSDPSDFFSDSDEWEEDEDLEEGEVNLFSNMTWINQSIGSMMEAQLTRPHAPNQCRWCMKFDEAITSKSEPEKFCSEECKAAWKQLMETRLAQGKHDLRVRGFD